MVKKSSLQEPEGPFRRYHAPGHPFWVCLVSTPLLCLSIEASLPQQRGLSVIQRDLQKQDIHLTPKLRLVRSRVRPTNEFTTMRNSLKMESLQWPNGGRFQRAIERHRYIVNHPEPHRKSWLRFFSSIDAGGADECTTPKHLYGIYQADSLRDHC